ncbi:hypothetical protein HII31_01516, partial [Pseudocercospora fuligena]
PHSTATKTRSNTKHRHLRSSYPHYTNTTITPVLASTKMSHSLKQKGAAHRSNHPKGTTAKEYNVNRRLYPYPDADEDEFASGTIRVHSIEGLNPRDRILESWTRCQKPKGTVDGNCVKGHYGYYVRLQNGKLKAAIKLYGATCEHEGQDGVESEEESEEGDGEEEHAGKGEGEKKGGVAGTETVAGGTRVS